VTEPGSAPNARIPRRVFGPNSFGLYHFKTRRMVSGLRFHEIGYAAWQYSLIMPPSTFRR